METYRFASLRCSFKLTLLLPLDCTPHSSSQLPLTLSHSLSFFLSFFGLNLQWFIYTSEWFMSFACLWLLSSTTLNLILLLTIAFSYIHSFIFCIFKLFFFLFFCRGIFFQNSFSLHFILANFTRFHLTKHISFSNDSVKKIFSFIPIRTRPPSFSSSLSLYLSFSPSRFISLSLSPSLSLTHTHSRCQWLRICRLYLLQKVWN